MKKLPLVLLFAAGAAGAVDDALVLRCRALPDAAGRLACYEALPVAPPAEQRFGGKRLEKRSTTSRRRSAAPCAAA